MATNPLITQGTLNRVRASVVVPSYSSLNIISSFMGKGFVTVTFDGNFSELIATGTGGVSSPEPYIFCNVEVDLLRSQSLASDWLTQGQATSNLGDVHIHSDTSAFDAVQISETQIINIDPGAFDGMNPVVRLHLRGIFYINNNLWSLT